MTLRCYRSRAAHFLPVNPTAVHQDYGNDDSLFLHSFFLSCFLSVSFCCLFYSILFLKNTLHRYIVPGAASLFPVTENCKLIIYGGHGINPSKRRVEVIRLRRDLILLKAFDSGGFITEILCWKSSIF